jgi:hypothetical protein
MLERGGLIVGAGAALSAISPGIARADGNDRTSLEGGWIGTTDAGAGFGKFMAAYMFARGGGMVTSSSIDLSPRSLSTPGYGTWTRTGDRQFLMTFDAFVFDQQGNPAGVVESRATAVLDATGDAWSGVFKFEVRAPNGAVVFSGSGTHSATRIRPERV